MRVTGPQHSIVDVQSIVGGVRYWWFVGCCYQCCYCDLLCVDVLVVWGFVCIAIWPSGHSR